MTERRTCWFGLATLSVGRALVGKVTSLWPVVAVRFLPSARFVVKCKVARILPTLSGAQVKVLLRLPDEYPFKPPAVTVLTPVFHPNIGADGRVCADFLAGAFSPALTLVKIMLLICAMVHDPSTLVTDAVDNEAWELYTSNRDAYEARCRELCRLHAAMSAADVAAAIQQVLSKNPTSVRDSKGASSTQHAAGEKLPPPAS